MFLNYSGVFSDCLPLAGSNALVSDLRFGIVNFFRVWVVSFTI